MAVRALASWVVGRGGYALVRADKLDRRSRLPRPLSGDANARADFSSQELATIHAVTPYTMTSPERIVGLTHAVEYLVTNAIDGDVVECGVWRGGSMMAIARTLLRLGESSRTLHLFDTFEGMTPPTELDRDVNVRARARRPSSPRPTGGSFECLGAWRSLDEVRLTSRSTGYPEDHLPRARTGRGRRLRRRRAGADRAPPVGHRLVRVDTPRAQDAVPALVSGGVLIIDDFGHWEGARKAVEEYIAAHRLRLLLCRLDYTGRIAVKP